MNNKFDAQLIQVSKLKDKVILSKWFSSIPYYAQKVFSRKGGFKNYEVSYDDERQIEYLNKRASICDVIINNGKSIDINNSTETCSGQLLNCFVYLIEYLKADEGYQGAMTMYINDLNNLSDNELADFCIWINKWLTSFLQGMKYNKQLNSKVNIIYGL